VQLQMNNMDGEACDVCVCVSVWRYCVRAIWYWICPNSMSAQTEACVQAEKDVCWKRTQEPVYHTTNLGLLTIDRPRSSTIAFSNTHGSSKGNFQDLALCAYLIVSR